MAAQWLRIAALIATRSVNSTDICADLGISRNSFVRHQAEMERIYGLTMEYVRPDGRCAGWYKITDCGSAGNERCTRHFGS